ncbi:mRNA capping enzyme, alpha subunit [Aulographum hederae CBS 113979]|uniref:mRNA-capping enzyme subunit alpha n=1 Tax=Aulographum hederae CBS 113979 TaxID=1176131 RepID=A0A6G1GQL0_9PEZI|nr:mRNA capping enzyme, alpha subunit [Aulographum hederae CBS 113979]
MGGAVPQIPGHVVDPEIAQTMRREIATLLGRQSDHFPGAQPVSFARHHLQDLKQRDYYLCEKTDGIRCLLYCGEDNGNEFHYLIDRKNLYYWIENLHFPHHEDPLFWRWHVETLLDGELVNDTMPDGSVRLRFLVFDCLMMDGRNITNKHLDKRIGYVKEYMFKPYKEFIRQHPHELQRQPFQLELKQMEKPYAFEMMFKEKLPNLPHGNDGLVLTCKESNYIFGTDTNILKWKPADENSIDFLLSLGEFPEYDPEDGEEGLIRDYYAKPSFDLLVYHGSSDYRNFAQLYVSDEEWEKMKEMGEILDGRIIECFKDDQGRWRYKAAPEGWPRFRDDKKEANHISTVKSVLESIEDGVSEEDLIRAAQGIKEAWKARHPEEDREALQKKRPSSAAPPPSATPPSR